MSFKPPAGWQAENDKLFIHSSGVRLQLMAYRGEEGWYLIPVDLDLAVVKFDPTPEGRDKAFAAFAGGVLNVKPPKKAPAKEVKAVRGRGRRKPVLEDVEGEEGAGEEHPEPVAAVEEGEAEAEEDDEDEDEDEEKEEAGGED